MPRDLFFAEWAYAIYFLLIPLVLLFLLYGFRSRSKSIQTLFGEVGSALYGRQGWRVALKSLLISIALAMAVIALMNPQGNQRQEVETAEAPVDLYLLLDRSLSMDVKDAKNGLPRFDRAKQIADNLLDQIRGEAVAVYGFTDSVELLVPLTFDTYFARLVLRDTSTTEGGRYGTDFEGVLKAVAEDLAERKFSNGSLLVILTDGEDTNWIGNPATPSLKVLENAKGLMGVPIAAVIIGTDEGGEIPYLKKDGKSVISKAQHGRLAELSQVEILQDQTDLVPHIESMIEQARKTTQIARSKEVIADSYYQVPLAIAMIAFVIAWYFPLARLPVLLIFCLPAFGEIWLQDRLYYNDAVQALEKSRGEEAADLLMGISPQAFPSPIFRSRIAINYALASLRQQNPDPLRIQTGLFVMRMMQLLPCDPLNLCQPELQAGALMSLQTALMDQTEKTGAFDHAFEIKAVEELMQAPDFPDELRDSYQDYLSTLSKTGVSWDYVPLLHYSALMPTPEVIDRLKILLSFSQDERLRNLEIKRGVESKQLLAATILLLSERSPQDAKEALRNLMQATVAVSFLQLMGAGDQERSAAADMFIAVKKRFATIQAEQFSKGLCQCSPWEQLMPLFWLGGGFLQQGIKASTTELRYGFENAAQEKFREAVAKSTPSKSSQSKERKMEQQLQEMQQMDRAQAPEKRIQDTGAGMPW
jgi:hypothetical protein